MPARFYTISDARYFVGTVALLNSLRLTGHDHELVVLDRGFTEEQCERLSPHATLFRLPEGTGGSTYAVKPYPALMEVDGVVAIIDSDMIVTSSLEHILATAATGRICAFPNHPSAVRRRFDEWSDLFELEAPLREGQQYLNAGFVAVSVDRRPGFFRRWWRACERLPENPPPRDDSMPLAQLDQDALNALLMSEVAAEDLEQLPGYEWDLSKVTIDDATTLRCHSLDGPMPLLHTPRTPKVFQPEGARHVEHATRAYLELLPRVLFADDVVVKARPEEVPFWVRPGVGPRVAARALAAYNRTPWVLARARHVPRRIGRVVRTALRPGQPPTD